MEPTNDYQVTHLVIRQAPMLDASGEVKATTVASFMVGTHGPFTLSWPTSNPAAADITAAIKAKVDELRQVATSVAALNKQP